MTPVAVEEPPRPSVGRLVVYDVLSREVAVLIDRELQEGEHEVALVGSTFPSGTYVVRLEAGGIVTTGRVTLVR